MGDEVNLNKIVSSLLVIAGVLFLFGTMLVIGVYSDYAITGKATTVSDSGTANLTITGSTGLTNQYKNISWGVGYVNISNSSCNMKTTGEKDIYACVDFTTVSKGFLLENTGNSNISINYTSSADLNTFIGGTNPIFRYNVTTNLAEQQDDDSSIDTVASCSNLWNSSGGPEAGNWKDVVVGGDWLCGNASDYDLDPSADRDAGVMNLQIQIPDNAPSGDKTVLFQFWGHSAL